jgi:hypothetical protein
MKRMLTAICTSALLLPAAASAHYTVGGDAASAVNKTNASMAKAGQFEGTLARNSCSAAHPFTVSHAGPVTVLVAGTNISGDLFAQVLGPDGRAGSQNGFYYASTPGAYSARVCYTASGDGTDQATVSYVGTIAGA